MQQLLADKAASIWQQALLAAHTKLNQMRCNAHCRKPINGRAHPFCRLKFANSLQTLLRMCGCSHAHRAAAVSPQKQAPVLAIR